MRRAIIAGALVLGLGGGGVAPALAQDSVLPEGDGRDIVQAICSGCHSLRLVAQQGMSRKRWDKTLDWMVEQQGMPQLDPETERVILDYLGEHLGPRQQETGTSPYNTMQPLQPAQ